MWLSRSEKELKDQAKREAFDLWLACQTYEDVAERVGWPKQTISRWLDGLSQKPEIGEMGQTDSDDQDSGESPLKLTKEQLAVLCGEELALRVYPSKFLKDAVSSLGFSASKSLSE